MKNLMILILLAVLSMSCSSTPRQPQGLINGHLAPCPNTPNCVTSEKETSVAYINPLIVKNEPKQAWLCLKRTIEALGGTIEREEEHYLWATFKTKIFRFVDDMELRLDADSTKIHVRSASRVGYSDLGINRKRVEALRERFAQEQERVLNP